MLKEEFSSQFSLQMLEADVSVTSLDYTRPEITCEIECTLLYSFSFTKHTMYQNKTLHFDKANVF